MMTRKSEIAYYSACEQRERQLAEDPAEIGTRALHLVFARLFAELVHSNGVDQAEPEPASFPAWQAAAIGQPVDRHSAGAAS